MSHLSKWIKSTTGFVAALLMTNCNHAEVKPNDQAVGGNAENSTIKTASEPNTESALNTEENQNTDESQKIDENQKIDEPDEMTPEEMQRIMEPMPDPPAPVYGPPEWFENDPPGEPQ